MVGGKVGMAGHDCKRRDGSINDLRWHLHLERVQTQTWAHSPTIIPTHLPAGVTRSLGAVAGRRCGPDVVVGREAGRIWAFDPGPRQGRPTSSRNPR